MSDSIFAQLGRWIQKLTGSSDHRHPSSNEYRGEMSKEPTAEEVERVKHDVDDPDAHH
jgi:hypothetical protein